MIQIQVDEQVVKQLYIDAINRKIEEFEADLVFWDTKELKRRTRMSWNTIQDTFFHNEQFPKVKVGGKWYFPAKECERFLLKWLNEMR